MISVISGLFGGWGNGYGKICLWIFRRVIFLEIVKSACLIYFRLGNCFNKDYKKRLAVS